MFQLVYAGLSGSGQCLAGLSGSGQVIASQEVSVGLDGSLWVYMNPGGSWHLNSGSQQV